MNMLRIILFLAIAAMGLAACQDTESDTQPLVGNHGGTDGHGNLGGGMSADNEVNTLFQPMFGKANSLNQVSSTLPHTTDIETMDEGYSDELIEANEEMIDDFEDEMEDRSNEEM